MGGRLVYVNNCHCEERSDVAIRLPLRLAAQETTGLDEIKERLGHALAGGAHPRRI